jgi:plastocyanin
VAATIALPAVAAAKTKVVYAGGPVNFQNQIGARYGAGVDNFLINTVTINVGDSVNWNGKARAAGFHSIDIPASGGGDLPLLGPSGGLVSPSVVDAAGNAFWFDGLLPNIGFNPMLFGPLGGHAYNGTARIDSGLPVGPPRDFKVKFTKAGVYKYFCDVHYGMVGYVVVLAKGKKVPSGAADRATLRAEENAYVKAAKKLDKTKIKGDKVQLGASSSGGLEVFQMFPAKLTVTAGTTVTFSMSKDTREAHTATFGPGAAQSLGSPKVFAGTYLGMLAASFASPVPDPRAIFPSSPPGTITLGPTSHGNGFASVGVLDQDTATPALPASGTITFTTPGKYRFICLIHPFMTGVIVVK